MLESTYDPYTFWQGTGRGSKFFMKEIPRDEKFKLEGGKLYGETVQKEKRLRGKTLKRK